jgi:acyl-coenzyme A synthetase/AMP-(fatty) acid ligase
LPDRVVFREALPRTGTGKFSKRELRQIYAGIYSSETLINRTSSHD